MALLEDTAIFAAVIQQGGFSHAAKHLGLSNGLVSRRIAQLEATLGVTLIKRTTRQFHLTPEGEMLWRHAQKIQQELATAVNLIQTAIHKPKGTIRISAPVYFGRQYLTPLIMNFLEDLKDIQIELLLSNQQLNPIKEGLDLVIRGVGYFQKPVLKDSSLKIKLLHKDKIGLYASPDYLRQYGEPHTAEELIHHPFIHYKDKISVEESVILKYQFKNQKKDITLKAKFSANDIESNLIACAKGNGIGKFTALNTQQLCHEKKLYPILTPYYWGEYHLYALYPAQQALPHRVNLFLKFIASSIQNGGLFLHGE